jgi:hypothetical protein
MTDVMWQLIEDAWQPDPIARPPMHQLEDRLSLADDVHILDGQRSGFRSSRRWSRRELVIRSIPQSSTNQRGASTSSTTDLSLPSYVHVHGAGDTPDAEEFSLTKSQEMIGLLEPEYISAADVGPRLAESSVAEGLV